MNITKEDWTTFINDGGEYEFFHQILINKENPEIIITQIIGWLTYILYRLCGRLGMDPSDMVNRYYLSGH